MKTQKKKRNKKYRGIYAGLLPVAIRFTDEDSRYLKMEPHAALIKMADGLGDGDTFNALMLRLNTGKILAEQYFNDDAIDLICRSLLVMDQVRSRYYRMEKWGISPEEKETVHEALVLADDIQDGSTRREQRNAMRHVIYAASCN